MQARTRSSSLSAVSEARTRGEGSGATSVGCMGGWIHTGLRGTLAGDLNNCRGWDGGIGFQGWNRCISFRVNPINPAWKQHAMCGTSTISTLNKKLVAGGGNWIGRRHIIVMHGGRKHTTAHVLSAKKKYCFCTNCTTVWNCKI
jgi:hypothetical protein